jgi:lipopolysaccharide heptosyltransferase II
MAIAKRVLTSVAAGAFALYGLKERILGPRRAPRPEEIRRILVIRLDLMGDIVFSIPAIELLAERFPRAHIDALALPYAADLLRGVEALSHVHQIDVNAYRRPSGWRHARRLVATIWRLRRERYDLAIGLSGLMGGVFAVLSGARWRVGYARETFGGCYNLPQAGRRYEKPQHEVEYCLDLVRALPSDAEPGEPRVPMLRAERTVARLDLPDTPYAVLVPGASNGAAKRWPAAFWAQLGDRIARECGLAIVLSGAASERSLVQQVADAMDASATNAAGRTSITELVDLLRDAEIVVAGDTGPLHVASALDRPVVGIFGPTDPTNTGPLASRAIVVRRDLTCSPCYDLRSPADCKLPDRSMPCMWGLSPDAVFESVRQLLKTPA